MRLAKMAADDFNPRSPHGERRSAPNSCTPVSYFNPRSPHGERLRLFQIVAKVGKFQSTLPARGATSPTLWLAARLSRFQSTLPARGATSPPKPRRCARTDISIHAPRTGSDDRQNAAVVRGRISIHAPRTGSDQRHIIAIKLPFQFQSTLPARGATVSLAVSWS